MKSESYFLFINSCLGQWQTLTDLQIIMQCSQRTVRRIANTFRDMCLTNELFNFIFEQDLITPYIKGWTYRFRIRIKK